MKTNICFLLLLALLLFLLFILARGFWSRRFKTACHFALLDLQGNFHVQWTRSGFVARSPWDAPHLAWPRAYHFAFCYWVNLLLSNFSAKCSLGNITHCLNLIDKEMLLKLRFSLQLEPTHLWAGEGHKINHPHHPFNRPHHFTTTTHIKMRETGVLVPRAVINHASQQTRTYFEKCWSRGSMCASSLQGRTRFWT